MQYPYALHHTDHTVGETSGLSYKHSNKRSRVLIIFTGGTISMTVDQAFGGIVPSLSGQDILRRTPSVYEHADISVIDFGQYPGPHITPEIMWELSQLIQHHADTSDIDGIVVTHGTDTLEETAYFLDCTISTHKPIVVVGSMRNSSEPDWDGPRNLRDCIAIASHPRAQNLGVLVCLAEEIHAASEVSKLNTSNVSTFESPNFGPIGRIVNGAVMLYRKPVHRDHFVVKQLPTFVPLLTCYTSSEARILQATVGMRPNGIVIEAMGVGNVPPQMYEEIVHAIKTGIPVVLVSRCPIGRVEHLYAYQGAGKQLYQAGVIFADYLNGQKARIKLITMLGAGASHEELRHSFEWSA